MPENSIYNLKSNFINKENKSINIVELEGKIQIFSMIYTNCKTICPIIISNMKSIERLIPSDIIDHVNFTLITLDPERDTPITLKKFFNEKKFTNRWNLFRTTKEETLKLALMLGIKYKKDKNSEYTHSNLIIILDKNGEIKLHHQGLDKNYTPLIELLAKLK